MKDKRFHIYLFLAILETGFLIYFSFLPSVSIARPAFIFRLGDIEHFVAYFVYGFLLNRVFRYYVNSIRKVIILSFVIGVLVGGLNETIQFFVPFREADVTDVIVDGSGSFFGSYVGSKIRKA
jgi:VanZ family protein